MRLPLVALVTLAVAPLSAQQPAAAKKTEGAPKPKIVAPAPAPTPAPKRGVMNRIFGPKATPAPAPAATPTPAPAPAPTAAKPKPKPRPKPKATAESTTPKPEAEKPEAEKPKAETTETPAAETPKDEAPKPEAAAETEKPKAAVEPPKSKTGKTGKTGKATPPAPKAEEAPLDEATKYKNARAKALDDEQVKELKGKADTAIDNDEAHRATVNYNRALFRKIRQLDPSLDGYVDKLEEAMNKRLSAEKREQ